MARRKSKSKLRSRTGRDIVNTSIARRSLPRPSYKVRTAQQFLLDMARLTGQDDRTWSAARPPRRSLISTRPSSPRRIDGRFALVGVSRHGPLRTARMEFHVPEKVTVCVRRGVRREVLHARGIAGSRGIKKRRVKSTSKIRC